MRTIIRNGRKKRLLVIYHSTGPWRLQVLSILNSDRIYRAVLAINMASRRSFLGPALARTMYLLWQLAWEVFLIFRRALLGDMARFNVHGKYLAMSLSDKSITRILFIFREYEPAETKFVARQLSPGMTFIDIGANSGYYSLLAAQIVSQQGRVFAFEPNPSNVEILRTNIAANGLENVVAEELAISSRTGEVNLYLSSINEGDHRIYEGRDDDFYNAGRERLAIRVQTTTLDRYLEGFASSVDFVKLDIQGAEHEALKGMKRTLSGNADIVLMTEYWPYGLRKCGSEPIILLYEMEELGFMIFQLEAGPRLSVIQAENWETAAWGRDAVTLVFSRTPLEW